MVIPTRIQYVRCAWVTNDGHQCALARGHSIPHQDTWPPTTHTPADPVGPSVEAPTP